MYIKAKQMINEGKLPQYKKRSLELSDKYRLDVLLSTFRKEIANENN